MTKIPLNGGHIVEIDDEDLSVIEGYNWYAEKRRNKIYARGKLPGSRRWGPYMHNLIAGTPKGSVTDHWDGNGLNNKRSNLRTCLQGFNCCNTTKKRSYKRFKGVFLDKRRGTWCVQIGFQRKRYFAGPFNNEEDAARAYDALAIKYHGEFALLNFEGAR